MIPIITMPFLYHNVRGIFYKYHNFFSSSKARESRFSWQLFLFHAVVINLLLVSQKKQETKKKDHNVFVNAS